MPTKRKQVLFDGKTYQRRKDGRYENINDKSDTISRRQAEKAELAEQGYASFEAKAKSRKELGISKLFKEKRLKGSKDKIYESVHIASTFELTYRIGELPKRAIAMVKARLTAWGESSKKSLRSFLGAAGGNSLWSAITSYNTPDALLSRYDFDEIEENFYDSGLTVDYYVIAYRLRK